MAYKVRYKVSYHKGTTFISPYPSPMFNQFLEYTIIENTSTDPISTHLPTFSEIYSDADNNKQYTFTLKDGTKTNDLNTPIKDVEKVTIAYVDGQYNSISFEGLSYIKTVDKLNITDNITDMSYMFCDCTSLESIPDISKWDTSNVTNINALFRDCTSLVSLDLHNLDFSSAIYCEGLFFNCSSLTTLNISGWKTDSLQYMAYFCYGCSSLKEVDLTSINTSKAINLCCVFQECTSLEKVDISTWNTASAQYTYRNFTNVPQSCLVYYNSNLWTLPTSGTGFDVTFIDVNYRVEYTIEPANDTDVISTVRTYSIEIPGYGTYSDYSNIYIPNADEEFTFRLFLKDGTESHDIDNTLAKDVERICAYYPVNTERIQFCGMGAGPDYVHRLKDIKYIKTDNFTSLNTFLYYCNHLESLDVSNWNTSNITELNFVFTCCESLRKIDGLETWDVSKVTDMDSVFGNIPVKALNLSTWNTRNVTNMCKMFCDCTSLSELILPENFVTNKVTIINNMFQNCESLTNIDVSKWDVSNVTNFNFVFGGIGLKEIDLSSWNTGKATSMMSLFNGCHNLEKINMSNWDCSKVTSMNFAFNGCILLKEIDMYNVTKTLPSTCTVDNLFGSGDFESKPEMIFISSNNNAIKTNYSDRPYIYRNEYTVDTSLEYINGVLIDWDKLERTYVTVSGDASVSFVNNFDPENAKSNYLVDWGDGTLDYELNHTYQTPGIYTIKTLNFATDGSYNEYDYFINNNTTARTLNFKVSNYPYSNFDFMCAYMTSLSNLDVTNINTNNSTSMNSMFYNCETLSTTLDVTNWTIDNVNNLSYTFGKCKNLEIVGLENWNTKNLVDSSNLFYYCDKLKSIDLSSWDTSNLKIIDGMFSYCANLESINITNWDSSNLESAHDLFSGCQKLSNLQGITNLVTSKMTNIYQMFYACKELVTLDLSGWDTSNINQITCLFHTCIKLTSIIGIENWNMQNVNNSGSMFYNCAGLKELDLSKWNLNLTNISSTFNGCEGLTKLNISTWDTRNVSGINNIRWAFFGVPESVDWCYDGTNYINFTLPESQTSFSGTFPWNA